MTETLAHNDQDPTNTFPTPPRPPEVEKPEHQYQILTLDHYKDRITRQQGVDLPPDFSTDEKMRATYVERTDRLINQIVERGCDTVMYLDKSARPVSWMVRELWDVFAPGEPKPETKFMNVDAHHWLGETEARPETHEVANMIIPQTLTDELRGLYKDEFYKKDSDGSLLRDENGQRVGKRVLIVDEISVTGSSLALAKKMLMTAFPGVEFLTAPWLTGTKVKRGSRMVPAELTVWYHETDVRGRGVGDIKSGSQVLSERLDEPDPLSAALQADIRKLGADVRSGKQAIKPFQSNDSIYYNTDESGKIDYDNPKYKIDKAEY